MYDSGPISQGLKPSLKHVIQLLENAESPGPTRTLVPRGSTSGATQFSVNPIAVPCRKPDAPTLFHLSSSKCSRIYIVFTFQSAAFAVSLFFICFPYMKNFEQWRKTLTAKISKNKDKKKKMISAGLWYRPQLKIPELSETLWNRLLSRSIALSWKRNPRIVSIVYS